LLLPYQRLTYEQYGCEVVGVQLPCHTDLISGSAIKEIIRSFIHYKDLYSASSRGTTTDLSCRRNVCTILPGGGAGKKNLKKTLISQTKEA